MITFTERNKTPWQSVWPALSAPIRKETQFSLLFLADIGSANAPECYRYAYVTHPVRLNRVHVVNGAAGQRASRRTVWSG